MTTKKYLILTLILTIMGLVLLPALCEEDTPEQDAKTAAVSYDLLHNVNTNESVKANEIGDFKIFEFDNPSKDILSYDHETNEIVVAANYGRGVIYTLPEDLYNNASIETPAEFWEYSMTMRMTAPIDDEWARLANSGIQFFDGDKLLGQFIVKYWNQAPDNGISISLYSHDNVTEKYLLGKYTNNIYPDKPTEEDMADMMRIYDWITIKVTLSFKITADGTATIIYGNDTLTGKIDNFDIENSAPAFRILGIGDSAQTMIYVSNVTFSCE